MPSTPTRLQGGINVRLAAEGETFLALDGRTYSLRPDMLMIADDARAVAIAGVMGGEDTGVTATTRNVLLESAWFLPASVRRTARTLNLPSDASYRFERGVDPAMTLRASATGHPAHARNRRRPTDGGYGGRRTGATAARTGEASLSPLRRTARRFHSARDNRPHFGRIRIAAARRVRRQCNAGSSQHSAPICNARSI